MSALLDKIKKDPWVVAEIPAESLNDELCLAALKPGYEFVFHRLHEENKTLKVCLAAVKINAYLLCSVPEKYKTYRFYLEMAKANRWALQHVPVEHRREELLAAQARLRA